MVSTVDEQINECIKSKTNFLLSGGAGSGKTYMLIQTLHQVFKSNPKARIACITYTNVAANEIKERSPYSKLHVSTIHDFLWNEIKEYNVNLVKTVLALISSEKENKGSGLAYAGEKQLNEQNLTCIKYDKYPKLEEGLISHDDLLKVANYMFATYHLLSKILCDKYDYIFVDEYQDTHEKVIQIFLNHINLRAKGSLCIGFFGDKMQAIYQHGIGNIEPYIKSGYVREIVKEDNYRCSQQVIGLLNNIRTDIHQRPAKKNPDNSIANKDGKAIFVCSNEEFNLEKFKESHFVSHWNFEDLHETKVLLLTHRLNAKQLGFDDLLTAFGNNNRLMSDEPVRLAAHLLKIGGILFFYDKKDFANVINEIELKIETNRDKQRISSVLSRLNGDQKNITIEDLIYEFDHEKLVRKDDKFYAFIESQSEIYEKVKKLPASQALAYFIYYFNHSPFSTQHGIKGAEFNNVLVVMDNGHWTTYNFKYYFEKSGHNTSVRERTEKMFYVCCSRAKDNLVVYYPSPTQEIIEGAKALFGSKNVLSYPN